MNNMKWWSVIAANSFMANINTTPLKINKINE